MEILRDGKKVGKQSSHDEAPFSKEEELFCIQVGSMNTGAAPAEAAIDNLRISSRPRYDADFTPPKSMECDGLTMILFPLDGDLVGIRPDGMKVEGRAGPVM